MRARVAALGLIGAACVGAWAHVSICPFAFLTGIPCPGCGLGRATLALLSGHPGDALRWHPLVFVVLPVAFVLLAAQTEFVKTMVRRWNATWAERIAAVMAASLLIALVGVWVARFGGAFGGPVAVKRLFGT